MGSLHGVFEPRMSVLPNRVVAYSVYLGDKPRKGIMPINNLNTGLISKKQAGRMAHYIRLLYVTSKLKRVYDKSLNRWFSYRINFITLTLPSAQIHTDKEVHNQCFKPFIRALKAHCPDLLYLFKAEVQDNGSLHYHVTTNSFIHYSKLRGLWNHYVNKLGYVDRCKVDNPNSTDIHSVKGKGNIVSYLVGYCSKKDLHDKVLKRYHKRYKQAHSDTTKDRCAIPKNYFKHIKRRVTIKPWDCSKALKIGKCTVMGGDYETDNELNMIDIESSNKLIGDNYTLYDVAPTTWNKLNVIKGAWEGYVSNLRSIARRTPSVEYI
jgi:hypothetical protein